MPMKFITWNSCAGSEISACPQQISPIQRADFADKVLSAMRKQFGGHDEKPSTAPGA